MSKDLSIVSAQNHWAPMTLSPSFFDAQLSPMSLLLYPRFLSPLSIHLPSRLPFTNSSNSPLPLPSPPHPPTLG